MPKSFESLLVLLKLSGSKFTKGSGVARSLPVNFFIALFKGQKANIKVIFLQIMFLMEISSIPIKIGDSILKVFLMHLRCENVINNQELLQIIFLTSRKNLFYLFLWLDCDKEGENICFDV